MGVQDCAGSKCYDGMIPGVTGWDAVKQRYRSDGDENIAGITVSTKPFQVYVMTAGSRTDRSRRLDTIDIYSPEAGKMPTLGSVLLAYGPPCAVTEDLINAGVTLA